MKYVLNEKYILNEAKFILDEYFILTEDTTSRQALINTVLTKTLAAGYSTTILDKCILNIKTQINTIKILKQISKVFKTYEADKDKNSGFDILKKDMTDYIKTVKQYIPQNLLSAAPEVNSAVSEIEDLLSKPLTEEADKTILTGKFEKLSTAIMKNFENGGVADQKSVTELITKINSFKEDLVDLTEILKKAKDSEAVSKDLDTFEAELKELNTQLTNNAKNINELQTKAIDQDKTTLAAETKNVEQIAFKVYTFVEKYKNTQIFNTPNNATLSTKKDWKTLFANEHDQQKKAILWKEYLTTEWGQNAEVVGKLGEAFTQELQEFGFGSASNPFIRMLQKLFAKDIKPTEGSYSAIHNAYVANYLSKADIIGEGTFKTNNIIFCPDLHINKKVAEINEYLLYQSQLKNADANKLSVSFADNILLPTWKNDLFMTVMYTDGEAEIVDNKLHIKKISTATTTLRPLTVVHEFTAASTNATGTSEKQDLTVDTATKIIDELTTRIGINITDYKKIISEIVYFYVLDISNLTDIQNFINSTSKDPIDASNTLPDCAKNTTKKEILKRKALYNQILKQFDLSVNGIKNLITAILKAAGAKK